MIKALVALLNTVYAIIIHYNLFKYSGISELAYNLIKNNSIEVRSNRNGIPTKHIIVAESGRDRVHNM